MNRQRRAFTLVEVMAVIFAGSVIMVLAMKMVHRTMHIASQANANAIIERDATRLSRQFRYDIHRAESFSVNTDQAQITRLRLVLPDEHTISYRVESSQILRQQGRDDDSCHREEYSFPDNFAIQITELTDPQRVVLSIQSDTGLVHIAPRSTLHVEAVVGRFLSLDQPQEVAQ